MDTYIGFLIKDHKKEDYINFPDVKQDSKTGFVKFKVSDDEYIWLAPIYIPKLSQFIMGLYMGTITENREYQHRQTFLLLKINESMNSIYQFAAFPVQDLIYEGEIR